MLPSKDVPVETYAPSAPPFGELPAEPAAPDRRRVKFFLGVAQGLATGLGVDRPVALGFMAVVLNEAAEPESGFSEPAREGFSAASLLCRRLAQIERCAAGRS